MVEDFVFHLEHFNHMRASFLKSSFVGIGISSIFIEPYMTLPC